MQRDVHVSLQRVSLWRTAILLSRVSRKEQHSTSRISVSSIHTHTKKHSSYFFVLPQSWILKAVLSPCCVHFLSVLGFAMFVGPQIAWKTVLETKGQPSPCLAPLVSRFWYQIYAASQWPMLLFPVSPSTEPCRCSSWSTLGHSLCTCSSTSALMSCMDLFPAHHRCLSLPSKSFIIIIHQLAMRSFSTWIRFPSSITQHCTSTSFLSLV